MLFVQTIHRANMFTKQPNVLLKRLPRLNPALCNACDASRRMDTIGVVSIGRVL